jgi:hypothetical protein
MRLRSIKAGMSIGLLFVATAMRVSWEVGVVSIRSGFWHYHPF